jgi:hypothetical protein
MIRPLFRYLFRRNPPDLAARKLVFDREVERISRPDGAFILRDRESGEVLGAGFSEPDGREERWELP